MSEAERDRAEQEQEEEEENEEETDEKVPNKKKKKKPKKKKKNNLNSNNNLEYQELRYYSVTTRDSGRCALAKEGISEGICILREQPYQVMSQGKLCLNCGTGLQLCVPNARTGAAASTTSGNRYCSPECANLFETTRYLLIKDKLSSFHEVSLLHDCSEELLHISFIIFFTKYFQLNEPINQQLFVEKNNFTVLSTSLGCDKQVSHLTEQTTQWKSAVTSAFETLLFDTFSSHFERDRDSHLVNILLEIAAKVNANSYGIFDDFTSTTESKPLLGFGVFPIAAMTINHSCRPNLVNLFVNGKMEYRTIRPIKKREELCVSYINCLQGFTQRRQELLSSRFFCCSCIRCKLHEHALLNLSSTLSLSADVLADLMLDGLHCNTCGWSLSSWPPFLLALIESLNS
jgi:hypothetical protein